MATNYRYKNIGTKTVQGRKYVRGKVGDAEFSNAKRATPRKGSTTRSSSTRASGSGDFSGHMMSTHSEPARKSRLGIKETPSGPKSRKPATKKKK